MTLPSRAAVEAGLQAHNAAFFAGKRHDDLTIAAIEAAYAVDFPGGAPQAGRASTGESTGTAEPGNRESEDALHQRPAASPASVRGEISEEEILTLHADCENEFAAIADAFNEGRGLLLAETQLIRAILRESRRGEGI